MSAKVDEKMDEVADRLEAFVEESRREGGLKAKLADALDEDPAFLRKLKPSLIAARARGETPPADAEPARRAPAGPQLDRPTPSRPGGGPSPWLVLGAAFALGVLIAKLIAWSGDAHPAG